MRGPPPKDEVDNSEGNEEDEEYRERNRGFGDYDQYIMHFHELFVRGKVVENKLQTLGCYRTCLHNELRKEMLITQLLNIDEAYQLALRVEKQLRFLNGRCISSTDPKQECTSTQLFQKPPLPTDQGRNIVVGDQRGKAKLTSDRP